MGIQERMEKAMGSTGDMFKLSGEAFVDGNIFGGIYNVLMGVGSFAGNTLTLGYANEWGESLYNSIEEDTNVMLTTLDGRYGYVTLVDENTGETVSRLYEKELKQNKDGEWEVDGHSDWKLCTDVDPETLTFDGFIESYPTDSMNIVQRIAADYGESVASADNLIKHDHYFVANAMSAVDVGAFALDVVGAKLMAAPLKQGATALGKTALVKGVNKALAKNIAVGALKEGTEEVAEVAAKTTVKASIKGVTKVVAKEGAEELAEGATKQATKVTVKSIAKTATKEAAEEVAEQSAKGVTKLTAKTIAKEGTEEVVEGVSKKSFKGMCKAAGEFVEQNAPASVKRAIKVAKVVGKPVGGAAILTVGVNTHGDEVVKQTRECQKFGIEEATKAEVKTSLEEVFSDLSQTGEDLGGSALDEFMKAHHNIAKFVNTCRAAAKATGDTISKTEIGSCATAAVLKVKSSIDAWIHDSVSVYKNTSIKDLGNSLQAKYSKSTATWRENYINTVKAYDKQWDVDSSTRHILVNPQPALTSSPEFSV